jgi:uncharacterized repeat protein (TIGR03803 family)
MYAVTALVSSAQTFTTLVNFDGTNGWSPSNAPLIQATNGDLYGTTSLGGTNNYGVIFRMTPAGVLTTLDSFEGTGNASGAGGLVQIKSGYIYGTSWTGGANGYGFIFKISPAGAFTTIYSFDGSKGVGPAGLVQAANGNLYGYGNNSGLGTVFEITPFGALTTLHYFVGPDGFDPYTLIQGTSGDFYGTTLEGGNPNACQGQGGCGTIFRMSPSGTLTTLYSFSGTDGQGPDGLMQATNGDFYGTTELGGTNGYGTIFRITSAGVFTSLYSFDSTNGAFPYEGLIQASDGNLYGTTSQGGTNGLGTIFKITKTGLATVHIFAGNDGMYPVGNLLQDTNGSLYGTTLGGGTINYGTVFRLSLGLAPFVKTLPTVGLVGSTVKILGSNLTGATSVTFNGVPSLFTVVSAREISTTVPAGATTGKVEVVTPSGALTSNVAFAVH